MSAKEEKRGAAVMKVVVSGSRRIKQLPEEAEQVLRKIMQLECQVLVGDCHGVDLAVQRFLHAHRYPKVTVFHVGLRPRHNVGFPSVSVHGNRQEAKDMRMCREADCGLAIWDGQSPGTKRNIERVPRTRVITVGGV